VPFLNGGCADLTGYASGSLVIQGWTRRDNTGVPLWEVMCDVCHSRQIIGHRRLAAAIETKAALPCTSSNCPSKRNHSESFTEFLRRERREAEQAARLTASAAAKSERETAERQTKEAALAALKTQYGEFFRHQMISAGVFDELIPKWERWIRLPSEDRQRIMAAIRQRPDVRVEIQ
jgi:hypothetical protein